jgi:hypothetical protein
LRIKAYDAMSDECVEQWVVNHRWGDACALTDLSDGLKLDGIWTWVNGSDPVQIASREAYRPTDAMKMDATHRYTERNELLFSMRSALAALGANTMQRLHVLASAYPMSNVGKNDFMIGQVPEWLDKDEALSTEGRVSLHHDAEFFGLMEGRDSRSTPSGVEEWKTASIPSFNSLAVESQLFNLENTLSDQLVYYCDDFFTLRPLALSDFTTPLYGPVIKTFSRITSMYLPSKNPIQRITNPSGEETGIKRAAWVLGQRFSTRPYYYITHHPRTLWLPLLREAAQTFPDAFSDTALSRFRAETGVPTPIQAVFLASWYIVERHREALLWSWAVAKWAGTDDIISPAMKERMWTELAGETPSPGSHIKVHVPIRSPVEDVETFAKANIDIPTSTEYSFSSKDGYALSYLDSMWFWNRPRHGYPDLTRGLVQLEGGRNDTTGLHGETYFAKDPNFRPATACSISRSYCFGSASKDESASTFFKRIAFEQPECGDCIITALIDVSGVAGIDRFLPAASVPLPSGGSFNGPTTPPHLPLTSDWETTDFSLAHSVTKESSRSSMTLRTWCARLIQRYSYVLGSTSSELYKMEKAAKVEAKLNEVEHEVQEDFEMNHISANADYEGHGSWRRLESTTKSLTKLKERWMHGMGDGRGPLAFLCLNDDIKETGQLRARLGQSLSDFLSTMWPSRMSFERKA